MSWIHYFAYGSNMLQPHLRMRTPSATALAPARLCGRQLDFGKLGRDGSGKCDVPIAAPAHAGTWGVVYAIRADEIRELDRIEGVPEHYMRVALAVEVGGRSHDVETYVARCRGTGLRPFDWYRALVIAGASRYRLPGDYIAWLAAHPCQPDPDLQRRTRLDAKAVLSSIASCVDSIHSGCTGP